MNLQPRSLTELADEIEAVKDADSEVASQLDGAYLAGLIRGMEWAAGKGVAPSEYLKMLERMPSYH